MTLRKIPWHRWVRIPDANKYLMLGWLPLSTLEGTHHGLYSVHMVWICKCKRREPV